MYTLKNYRVLNLLLRASFAPDIPNSDIPKPSKTPEE
jgi:hypothetical protein